MKLRSLVKPPRIGTIIPLKGGLRVQVMDWKPIIGYAPKKRWLLQVQVLKVKK